MTVENYVDFATTQLVGTTLVTQGTTFTVTTNTGNNFPVSSFVVTIDAEEIFIQSRSGDAFVIGTRGWNGTSIAAHSVGATVLLCATSYTIAHLWQNVADSYNPLVPVVRSQLSSVGVPTGTPTVYDTEFERATNWILYPVLASQGSVFNVNQAMRSHLVLNRYASNDNTLYTAYQPFAPGAAFTATCKVSDAINIPQNGTGQSVETHFFVSDQSNPTVSADAGNRFRIDVVTTAQQQNVTLNNSVQQEILSTARFVRCSIDVNGTWYPQSPLIPVPYAHPVFLRLSYDGTANWNVYVGDGYTYTLMVYHQNFPINCQSMGFQFYAGNVNPYYVSHTAAIDFVRVVTGTTLPPYGA